MLRKILPLILTVLSWSTALPADTSTVPLTIVLIGDSTVSEYPEENPKRGWGQYIGDHFQPGTRIINLAKPGASTKTFLSLSNWGEALSSHADFMLIQFGHNDSHTPDKPEATDAQGAYKDNLRKMISAARAAGITPILITPMHRRFFNSKGMVTNELLPYVEAMQEVGSESQVPVVDLYTPSGEWFQRLGDVESTDLTAPEDRTHFTPAGAATLAGFVAKGLASADPRLEKAQRTE